MEEEILFYTNGRRTGAAFSVNGGVTVYIPTGRELNLLDVPVWEEVDEEEAPPLTAIQQAILDEFKARPPLDDFSRMAEELYRREALRRRRENAPPPTRIRAVRESALVVTSDCED